MIVLPPTLDISSPKLIAFPGESSKIPLDKAGVLEVNLSPTLKVLLEMNWDCLVKALNIVFGILMLSLGVIAFKLFL